MSVTDVALGFTLLATTEALVKPVAIAVAQWFIPRAAADALTVADRLIPDLLADGRSGADLERQLRNAMQDLTGDANWQRRDLTPIWRRFDPRILLDHHNG
jgi:hypothetical protein